MILGKLRCIHSVRSSGSSWTVLPLPPRTDRCESLYYKLLREGNYFIILNHGHAKTNATLLSKCIWILPPDNLDIVAAVLGGSTLRPAIGGFPPCAIGGRRFTGFGLSTNVSFLSSRIPQFDQVKGNHVLGSQSTCSRRHTHRPRRQRIPSLHRAIAAGR